MGAPIIGDEDLIGVEALADLRELYERGYEALDARVDYADLWPAARFLVETRVGHRES